MIRIVLLKSPPYSLTTIGSHNKFRLDQITNISGYVSFEDAHRYVAKEFTTLLTMDPRFWCYLLEDVIHLEDLHCCDINMEHLKGSIIVRGLLDRS